MSEPLEELEQLRRIARNLGAWKTQDGVWVHGPSLVYYLPDNKVFSMLEMEASTVAFFNRNYCSSTPAAATAHREARNKKENE